MVPLVGSVKPPIMRRQVVLPEPEGPSRVKNSPALHVQADVVDGAHLLAAGGEDARYVLETDGLRHGTSLMAPGIASAAAWAFADAPGRSGCQRPPRTAM